MVAVHHNLQPVTTQGELVNILSTMGTAFDTQVGDQPTRSGQRSQLVCTYCHRPCHIEDQCYTKKRAQQPNGQPASQLPQQQSGYVADADQFQVTEHNSAFMALGPVTPEETNRPDLQLTESLDLPVIKDIPADSTVFMDP